jgi:hypothetical protein
MLAAVLLMAVVESSRPRAIQDKAKERKCAPAGAVVVRRPPKATPEKA